MYSLTCGGDIDVETTECCCFSEWPSKQTTSTSFAFDTLRTCIYALKNSRLYRLLTPPMPRKNLDGPHDGYILYVHDHLLPGTWPPKKQRCVRDGSNKKGELTSYRLF